MYTVYKHTTPSKKVYIGITGLNPEDRFGKDGSKYKGQVFYGAIQKYGWQNIKHDILFQSEDQKEAERKEAEYIEAYRSRDTRYGYNVAEGGYICHHTDSTRRKMSATRRGRPLSEQHKQSLSAARKGTKISDEQKELLRRLHIGTKHTQEQKDKISRSCKGKGVKAVIKCSLSGEELEIFSSINDAAAAVGAKSTSNISSCCRGKRLNASGYIWKYA